MAGDLPALDLAVAPEKVIAIPELQPEPTVEQDDTPPLRVLVFDTYGTSSRLFSRSLSNYLRLGHVSHPYVIAATLGPDRIHTKIGNEQTKSLWESRVAAAPQRVTTTTYEHATNKLLRDADSLEQQGKTLFVVEYAPFIMKHDVMLSALQESQPGISKLFNPTVLSDELLAIFTPIIFIQHPARTIPAWLRLAKKEYGSYLVDEEDFTIWTSLRWSRILFEYLRSSHYQRRRDSMRVDSAHSTKSPKLEPTPTVVATRPYVIDAEDVANYPHASLATVCRLLNIELGTNSSWTQYFDKATEALKKVVPNSLMKVFNSAVLSPAADGIDVEQEMVQWRVEFGDEVAEVLKRKVEQDMPHYEYLKNFRVRILPSATMTAFMQNITGLPIRRQSVAAMPTRNVGVGPLKVIRTAIDGKPRERHFSC